MTALAEADLYPDMEVPALEDVEGGLKAGEHQRNAAALDSLVNSIREVYRVRQDLLRTEGDLQRRILAMRRRTGVSKALQSTPEEKVRFKLAEWLEDVLLWQAAQEQAIAEGKPFRRKPPARPVAPDGRGQRARDALLEGASPIPHGQEDEGGQDIGGPHATAAPLSSGLPDGAAFTARVHEVPYEVAFAIQATWVLVLTREQIRTHRMQEYDKPLIALAKQLPVYPWVDSVKGLAAISLAQIIGEVGNLSLYDNPAKVWKRMGLAVMPDGQRQRRVAGDAAIEHGYNPSRRAVMWVVGDNLIRATNETYYGLFLERREDEREINPEAAPIAHMRRAHRYMEKRLLRDLWRAWRDA
jgi:hypothetical protein